jgi:uncharacterized repeat protein (TIGR02543 family)
MEAINGFSPSRPALFSKVLCPLILVLCALWAIPASAQIYVSEDGGPGVGEFGLSGSAINTSFESLSSSPGAVAVSGSTLYVARATSSTVGTYNAVTGAVINASFITGLNSPNGIAISGTTLYVANIGSNSVGEYNAVTGAVINASFITGVSSPNYLCVSGSTLYVTNYTNTGPIGEYNAVTGAAINANFITGLYAPGGTAVSGSTLYVVVAGSNTIGTYNAVTGSPINANFITSNLNFPVNIALSGSNLFVTNQHANAVAEFNATSGVLTNGTFISNVFLCNGIAIASPVSTSSSPSVGGTTSGAGLYSSGVGATVTATPSAGYTFSSWTVNGSVVSTSSSYTFSVSGSTSLVANFTGANPVASDLIYVSNDGVGTVGEYLGNGSAINASLVNGLSGPGAVAVSGNTLYVAHAASGTVATYNATTGAATNLNFISGLSTPNGLLLSGTLLYVTNIGSNTVGTYNAVTGAVINASFITGLSSPGYLTMSGSSLFVSNSVAGNSTVGEYNAITGAAINSSLISGLSVPAGMAVSGSSIYVVVNGSNSIGEYNAVTGATINASFVTGLNYPVDLALSGTDLFVTEQYGSIVGEFDAGTGAAVNASLITGVSYCNGIVVAAKVATSASPSLGGTAAGAGIYSIGSSVTVTATANSGYTFSNWTQSGNIVSTSPSYTFSLSGSTPLVANFTSAPVDTLTVFANPGNGGIVSGSGTYADGSQQQISATANPGYVFTGWSDSVTTNPRTVTVPPGGVTYIAEFSPTDLLVVVADPTNGGTVSGGGTYADGSQIQISATANVGYAFAGWNDGVTTNPRIVTVLPGGVSYAANFVPQTDVLFVLADPAAGGTVMGSGTFPDNSQQQISATANTGYVFTGWDDGVTDNPRTVPIPLGGVEYVANFSPTAFLDVEASPSNAGTVMGSGTFAVGSFLQISAMANSGYTFTGWSDGVTANPRTVALPAGGVTYTAQYVVTYYPPAMPVNLTPANAASNVSAITTFKASPFSDPDVNATQLASEWTITRVSDSTVQDITEDTADMTFLSGVSLTASTAYQWSVRYEDSHDLWSPYSTPTLFITGSHIYRPDAVIGFSLRALIGTDVYSSDGDGETLSTSIHPLHSKTALIIAQNDGNVTDTLVMKGDGSNGKFVVRYFNGPDDVTHLVNLGTFRLRNMRPSARHGVRAIVAPRSNASPGDEFVVHVTISSLADPASTDTVVYDVTAQ